MEDSPATFAMAFVQANGRRPRLLELFKGTGSIGRVFEQYGFEVTSVDMNPRARATHTVDVLLFNYREYPVGYFDVVWGSPPCTEYSAAKTVGTRNFQLADAIVQRTKEINYYFDPACWMFENPWTGRLKRRDVVGGMLFKKVTYCKYGFPYMKPTALWHSYSLSSCVFRPPCSRASPCGQMIGRRHPATAQRGPSRRRPMATDRCFSQNMLYRIPEELVHDIVRNCINVISA